MTQHRASFDAAVTFSNRGGLQVQGFRVDIPSADTPDDEIARLFVASLGLLMSEQVTLTNVRRFEEAHKGTRGGPSDVRPDGAHTDAGLLVELNHVISAGLVTYPGLPEPTITPFLTREDSRSRYAEGTEFAMDMLTMIGNTGTYLDSPFHRYDDGRDLTTIALEQTVDLPCVVVRMVGSGQRAVDVTHLAPLDVRGKAVLIHTGDSARFGTPAYAVDGSYLTAAGAAHLVSEGAALVGIDSINIDDTADGYRPAHTTLLASGIPIVEHLTGLEQLPPSGARFTAVPLRVKDFGTIPVRAFARVP
jgi:kynurenine formamidase